MTIKELENRCGLDRATIRFYEKEGLIAPKRLSNGYRDYAEEDALALDKISLLRQLDFSLEEIRLVQRGQLPLGVALENRREGLLAQRVQADRALHIAEAIRKDGASYQTLQPKKYQDFLPPAPPNVTPALQAAQYPAHGYRLRRILSRLLDSLLLFLPILALLGYSLRSVWVVEDLSLVAMLLTGALLPFAEPLLLSIWGTTPGKWLMGLRLRFMGEDRKPTYGAALLRCLRIWWHGFGMFIPPFTYFCLHRCWLRAEKEEAQPWDAYDFDYTIEDRKGWHEHLLMTFTAALLALCLWATVALPLASTRPPNRGGSLTVQQYAENVNDTLSYVMGFDTVCQHTDGSYTIADRMLSTYGSQELFCARYRQTLVAADGLVTAVSFQIDTTIEPSPASVGYAAYQDRSRHEKLIRASFMALTGANDGQVQDLLEEKKIFDRRDDSLRTASLNGWTITGQPKSQEIFCYTIKGQEG